MDRLNKVRDLIKKENLDGLIIDEPIDLYYLSGLVLSVGRLVVTLGEVSRFVDGRYYEKCKREASFPVYLTKGYGKASEFASAWQLRGKRVGFDAVSTSYLNYQEFSHLEAEFIALKSPLKRVRAIKDEGEIVLLKEAAELAAKGYDFAVDLLRGDITEKEVARELEFFWLKSGGEKLSFSPHIAFGKNSAYPHHASGNQELKEEHLALIDIGVVRKGYHSDMTRVVFFSSIPSELERMYRVVKEAQKKAFEKCRAGVLIKEVDRAARGYIEEQGFGAFFPHSLGHGIGLEIHEFPILRSEGESSDLPLEENMVLTIEPGIYIPGLGGIRLEDTIVIKKEGFENLTMRPLSDALPLMKSAKKNR